MKGKLSQMNRIALIFHTRVSACVFSRAADCAIPAAVHVSRVAAGMLLARPLCCGAVLFVTAVAGGVAISFGPCAVVRQLLLDESVRVSCQPQIVAHYVILPPENCRAFSFSRALLVGLPLREGAFRIPPLMPFALISCRETCLLRR